ncbi:MAG: hypothetical protein GY754_02705 [bacterium]|nr:hypothetical protein [bacterium]
MKRNTFFSGVVFIGVACLLAFSGCEAGLTSNDGTGTSEDNDFSFSDMYAKIKTLQEEVDRLKASNTALSEALVTAGEDHAGAAQSITARMDDLEGTLEGVTRLTDPYTGQTTIRFSGVNLQVVNGLGYTNGVDDNEWTGGTVNGLGNLIVGYNEKKASGSNKSGSHNFIVGSKHNYSSYGGLVAGIRAAISGRYSSVSGGMDNTAGGNFSSVSGGDGNTASASYSSVSGGYYNIASGHTSSVSGGANNSAGGKYQHLP